MIKTYISEEALKAMTDICCLRSLEEIIQKSNMLYDGLLRDLKKIISGEENEIITRVIDRKIGKSFSLIRLAIEYDLPIVVSPGLEKFYDRDAQEFFNKTVRVIPLAMRAIEKEKNINIVLKDQDTKVGDIANKFWPRKVKVIGFSSIFNE